MEVNFSKYMDEYRGLVGSSEDPGDSLHHTMYFYSCFRLLKLFKPEQLDIYRSLYYFDWERYGIYVRSYQVGWWDEPDRMSRDQCTPLVIAMGLYGLKKRLLIFTLWHILRLGFFTNIRRNGSERSNDGEVYNSEGMRRNYNPKLPDLSGPEFWGLLIRGLNLWVFYPFLVLADLQTLFSALIWRYQTKGNDVLNHVLIVRYIVHKYPTPLGWLAAKVMDRPKMYEKFTKYCVRIGLPLHKWFANLI